MAQILRTRWQFQTSAGGPLALLTYYWDGTGAADTALVTEAHARVRAFWNSLAARVYSGATLIFAFPDGDFIEETTGDIVSQATGSAPAGVTFTGTGDVMPLQTQGLLRLRTGTFIGGRRLVGKQYLPGWTEGQNDILGTPTATWVTGVNTAAALLSTTVVTPLNQRVWHRPGGVGPGTSAIVSSRTASGQWAVLRSRRT